VGEIDKSSDMVVDLDGDVFCGCGDRCFGVESDDGLGRGRTLLLGEGMDTGEGECEDCKCEDGFLHLASILLSVGLDAERGGRGAAGMPQVTEKRQDFDGWRGVPCIKHGSGNFDAR
jgi:hypothetical protein